MGIDEARCNLTHYQRLLHQTPEVESATSFLQIESIYQELMLDDLDYEYRYRLTAANNFIRVTGDFFRKICELGLLQLYTTEVLWAIGRKAEFCIKNYLASGDRIFIVEVEKSAEKLAVYFPKIIRSTSKGISITSSFESLGLGDAQQGFWADILIRVAQYYLEQANPHFFSNKLDDPCRRDDESVDHKFIDDSVKDRYHEREKSVCLQLTEDIVKTIKPFRKDNPYFLFLQFNLFLNMKNIKKMKEISDQFTKIRNGVAAATQHEDFNLLKFNVYIKIDYFLSINVQAIKFKTLKNVIQDLHFLVTNETEDPINLHILHYYLAEAYALLGQIEAYRNEQDLTPEPLDLSSTSIEQHYQQAYQYILLSHHYNLQFIPAVTLLIRLHHYFGSDLARSSPLSKEEHQHQATLHEHRYHCASLDTSSIAPLYTASLAETVEPLESGLVKQLDPKSLDLPVTKETKPKRRKKKPKQGSNSTVSTSSFLEAASSETASPEAASSKPLFSETDSSEWSWFDASDFYTRQRSWELLIDEIKLLVAQCGIVAPYKIEYIDKKASELEPSLWPYSTKFFGKIAPSEKPTLLNAHELIMAVIVQFSTTAAPFCVQLFNALLLNPFPLFHLSEASDDTVGYKKQTHGIGDNDMSFFQVDPIPNPDSAKSLPPAVTYFCRYEAVRTSTAPTWLLKHKFFITQEKSHHYWDLLGEKKPALSKAMFQ